MLLGKQSLHLSIMRKEVKTMSQKLQVWQRESAAEALTELLNKRGEQGATLGEVKNCINSVLKLAQFPKSDFGKILFTAHTKKVGDLYYLMGTGPDKPESEKKSAKKNEGDTNGSQSVTLEGNLTVTVKGSGYNFKSTAKKIVITLSTLVLAFVFWWKQ